MKITGCKIDVVEVSFEGVMSGRHAVLRLTTDDELSGISYVSRVTPRTVRPIKLLIEAMVEALIAEDPTFIEAIHKRLYSPTLGAPLTGLERRAASAIDVACWDIAGKAMNTPVWKLAGGYRDRMPVSANWALMPGPPRDKIAKHLEDVIARGFRAVKAPCGLVPLDTAIDHVRFIRECVGPDVKIIVDGNFQWGLRDAIRFARETEELDLFWIEDPVASHDYQAMRQFTDTVRQRTCAGEVFQHKHEFATLLEGRCSDYVMIDQDLGLTGFLKVAHMAEAHGRSVVNHLAPEVLCHGLAAVPNGLIVGLVPWGQPLFTEPLRIEDGDLVMSNAPGLGLTLDEDRLAKSVVG